MVFDQNLDTQNLTCEEEMSYSKRDPRSPQSPAFRSKGYVMQGYRKRSASSRMSKRNLGANAIMNDSHFNQHKLPSFDSC